MEIDIIRKIKDISLDKKHRFYFIAKYIIENGSSISDITITQLAKTTYSSPSTINRFTKSLKLSGYKELIHIIKYFNYTLNEHTKMKDIDIENNSILERYHEYIESLEDTFALFLSEEKKIEALIIKLKEAKRINIYAFGATYGNVAEALQEMLLRLNFNVVASNNFHRSYCLANQSEKGTLNIFLSYSGETETLTQLAKVCKENNSETVAISKNSNNALSRVVDLNLNISSNDPIDALNSLSHQAVLVFYITMIMHKILLSDFSYYENLFRKSFIKKI